MDTVSKLFFFVLVTLRFTLKGVSRNSAFLNDKLYIEWHAEKEKELMGDL